MDTLGVKYVANKKAWMNMSVFSEWIKDVDSEMRRQGRHIILFIDNASSHGTEDDVCLSVTNVTLKFLSPNTTSHLKPLDQGIIRAFKAIYRKNMVRSLLSQMDECDSVQDLCRRITVLDAVNWVTKSWDLVKSDTIVKCFKHAGFSVSVSDDGHDDDEEEFEDDNVPLADLVSAFHLQTSDFGDLKSGEPTEDASANWERNLVDNFRQPVLAQDESDTEDAEEAKSTRPGSDMTHQEVLQCLEKLKNFAVEKDADYLNVIQDLKFMTEKKSAYEM